VAHSLTLTLASLAGNGIYHLTSTGTLRYDIYVGEFYYDDVFAVAPFANVFEYYGGVTGATIREVLQVLLEQVEEDTYLGLPSFVGGGSTLVDSAVYDLFINDFDDVTIVTALAAVLGLQEEEVWGNIVEWRSDETKDDYVDTTLCWSQGVGQLWPC